MRFSLIFVMLLIGSIYGAQAVTEKETTKVNLSNLKEEDYSDSTTADKDGEASEPSLTNEQNAQMMETMKKAKASQEAQRKALEELDSED